MKKYLYNSLSGILQKVLTSVLIFCSIPVFIHQLGVEQYGLFSILSIVGNLNVFANFGLQTALLVYLCRQGRSEQSNRDIVVSVLFTGLLSFSLSLLIWCGRDFFLNHILNISSEDYEQAVSLLQWLLMANFFLLLGQVFVAVLESMHRIVLTNTLQFVYNTIYWGGLILAVSLGSNFYWLGFTLFLSAFLWFLLIAGFAWKHWGGLSFVGDSKLLFQSLKKQLGYGSKVYMAGLVGMFFEPLSKILLSNFIGLQAVALFEVATKVRSNINDLIVRAANPINPLIAESEGGARLHQRLIQLSGYIQIFVTQLSVLLLFTLPFLVDIWLSNERLPSVVLFTVVLTLNLILFSPPSLPIYLYLMNRNLSQKTIYVQLSSMIGNIITFFLCYQLLAEKAILVSNFVGYLLSFLLCKYYQIHYMHSDVRQELRLYAKILCMAVISIVICGGIYFLLGPSWASLLLLPVVVLILSIMLARVLRLVSSNEITDFFASMPRVEQVLLKLFVA